MTLQSILTVIATLAVAVTLAHFAHRAMLRALQRPGRLDSGTAGAVARLAQYVVLVAGIWIALEAIGVNLSALFAAGAFFAVAVGLAMQNIAQNFLSGVVLMFERTIKPGDVLEVNGQVVRIEDLGLRATIARTRDDEDLVIPNSVLAQQTVTNYTLRDSVYRVRTTVGISYSADVPTAFDVLAAAAKGVAGQVQHHEPRVLLTDFGESSLSFEVSIWIENPWAARLTKSELNVAIWRALADAGISIPFRQIDVHVKLADRGLGSISGPPRQPDGVSPDSASPR